MLSASIFARIGSDKGHAPLSLPIAQKDGRIYGAVGHAPLRRK